MRRKGRPILVGTVSIEKSELLSGMLTRRGVKHEVLNAKHHQREAEIISQAGRLNAVTIATNMAGRGTDIILGGNPETMAWPNCRPNTDAFGSAAGGVEPARFRNRTARADEGRRPTRSRIGGLHVVGTSGTKLAASTCKLRGRCGRQGDTVRRDSSCRSKMTDADLRRRVGEETFLPASACKTAKRSKAAW